MVFTGCGVDVVGWSGCVLGGVGGWVSEFWTSGLVYMLILTVKHEYSVLNSIWPKSGLSEFGKTLFNFTWKM